LRVSGELAEFTGNIWQKKADHKKKLSKLSTQMPAAHRGMCVE
jgi:hypothetical protein